MPEPTIGKRFYGPHNRTILVVDPGDGDPSLIHHVSLNKVDSAPPRTMTRNAFDEFTAKGTFRNYQHGTTGKRRVKMRELDDGRIEYMDLDTGGIAHAKVGAWRRWRSQAD